MFSFRKTLPTRTATGEGRRETKAEVSPTDCPESPRLTPTLAEKMAKYGITRVPVDYFHVGEFRYTSLKDALAQAKKTNRD